MAQLDPDMLSALMTEQDALDEDRYKHLFDNMTEEERMKEAQARSELDTMMQDLYQECFTDKHLDLAGMLMEHFNAAKRNPDATEMQFTPDALKIIPWAKALVAMQLVQLAAQSTTDAEERAKIGEIQYKGIEIIALNYRSCREEITTMLLALADVGAAKKDASAPSSRPGSPSASPRRGSLLPQEEFNRMEAEVRTNEAKMAAILEKLQNGASDADAMELATEYSTLKAATNAILGDIKLKDPQVLVHEDWMEVNFTEKLRKIGAEVLNSTAYPELKKWANSMDALTAFTQDHSVTMLNDLLHSLSNIYKQNRTALSPKVGRKNKSRIGTLQAEGVKLNRAACFIRSFTALDDDDWMDACVAFTPEATTVVEQLSEQQDEKSLAEWASNVTLIVEYAREVERNIETVIEEREANVSLIATLLFADASGLYQKFLNCFENQHGTLAVDICKRNAPTTLLRWAHSLISLSTPLDASIVSIIAGFARDNATELAQQELDPSAEYKEPWKYYKDVSEPRSDEEWEALSTTAKVLPPEEMPAEMVEWSFAVTALKEYLQKLEEGMGAVIEEYTRNKAEIDHIMTAGLPPEEIKQEIAPRPPTETPQPPPPPPPVETKEEEEVATPDSGYIAGTLTAMIDETARAAEIDEMKSSLPKTEERRTATMPALPQSTIPPIGKANVEPNYEDEFAEDSSSEDVEEPIVHVKIESRALPPAVPTTSAPPPRPVPSAVSVPGEAEEESSPIETPKKKKRKSVVSIADGEGEEGGEEKKKKKKKKKKKDAEGDASEQGEVTEKKKKKKKKKRDPDAEENINDDSTASPRTAPSSVAPSPSPSPRSDARRPSFPNNPIPAIPSKAPLPPAGKDDLPTAMSASHVSTAVSSALSSGNNTQPEEEELQQPSRVMMVKPAIPEAPALPNKLAIAPAEDNEEEVAEDVDPTRVYVQPAPRTMAQTVRTNPDVARGIIFIQPRGE